MNQKLRQGRFPAGPQRYHKVIPPPCPNLSETFLLLNLNTRDNPDQKTRIGRNVPNFDARSLTAESLQPKLSKARSMPSQDVRHRFRSQWNM